MCDAIFVKPTDAAVFCNISEGMISVLLFRGNVLTLNCCIMFEEKHARRICIKHTERVQNTSQWPKLAPLFTSVAYSIVVPKGESHNLFFQPSDVLRNLSSDGFPFCYYRSNYCAVIWNLSKAEACNFLDFAGVLTTVPSFPRYLWTSFIFPILTTFVSENFFPEDEELNLYSIYLS
jgi:hypothetical protein